MMFLKQNLITITFIVIIAIWIMPTTVAFGEEDEEDEEVLRGND